MTKSLNEKRFIERKDRRRKRKIWEQPTTELKGMRFKWWGGRRVHSGRTHDQQTQTPITQPLQRPAFFLPFGKRSFSPLRRAKIKINKKKRYKQKPGFSSLLFLFCLWLLFVCTHWYVAVMEWGPAFSSSFLISFLLVFVLVFDPAFIEIENNTTGRCFFFFLGVHDGKWNRMLEKIEPRSCDAKEKWMEKRGNEKWKDWPCISH